MLRRLTQENRTKTDTFPEDFQITLPPVTTTDQQEFEEAVWAERYFELCYENKMWFDMLRTRKVRNDITKEWDDFVGHTTVYGETFTESQLLFPIPQREIDNNRNLEQNTGF